jgi:MFS family permease
MAQLADGLCLVALPLAALSWSSRPYAVAVVMFTARLPWLLLALPAGILVDRFDRRRLMQVASAARVLVLATLVAAILAGASGLPLLATAALLLGVAETLNDTATHTLVPSVVPRGELERANGQLQAVEFVGNDLLGPAVGGWLVAAGISWAFGTSAALYVCALALLAALPGGYRPAAPDPRTASGGLPLALRMLWTDPVLRTYAFVVCIMNVAVAAYFAVLPVIVVGPGGNGSSSTYGLLLTAGGLTGFAVGLAAAPLLQALGHRTCVLIGHAGLAIGVAVPFLTTATGPIAAGLVGTGLMILVNVVTVSTRQVRVPDALLGRVTSVYRQFAWGGLPIGAALAGVLSAVAGPRIVCLLAGLTVAACAVPMARVTPTRGPLHPEGTDS